MRHNCAVCNMSIKSELDCPVCGQPAKSVKTYRARLQSLYTKRKLKLKLKLYARRSRKEGQLERKEELTWTQTKMKESEQAKIDSGMTVITTIQQGDKKYQSKSRDISKTPPKYLSPGSTARRDYFAAKSRI